MSDKKYYICGDLHGSTFPVLYNMAEIINDSEDKDPSHYALVLLGDVGFNYHKPDSWQSKKLKKKASKYGFTLYCLRGNHEDRASNNFNLHWFWDEEVGGNVGYELEFPNIKYLNDKVDFYYFGGYKCLTIPGAYSVDKYYRLQMGWDWFPEEQLTGMEMNNGMRLAKDNSFDFILSHTCPMSYVPKHLFLSAVDQSKVDNTMEWWMDDVVKACSWKYLCFAHYHSDEIIAPHVHLIYQKPLAMDDIASYWEQYDKEGSALERR